MPQMSPLPWVSLMVMVLSLMMIYMVLVYFSTKSSLRMHIVKAEKVNYSWKW